MVVLGVCICAVFEGELRGVGVSLLNGVVERRLAVFAPRVWVCAAAVEGCDVAGLSLPCRVVGCGVAVFWGFAPSLAWRAARRGRVCREGGVLRLPAVFLYYGLLFVVVGCLVRLPWFLWSCAVWRGLWVFLDAPLRVPPLVGTVGYI